MPVVRDKSIRKLKMLKKRKKRKLNEESAATNEVDTQLVESQDAQEKEEQLEKEEITGNCQYLMTVLENYLLDACREETDSKVKMVEETEDCSSAKKKRKIEEQGSGELK